MRPTQRRTRRAIVVIAVVMGLAAVGGSAYALGLFDPLTESTNPSSAVVDAQAAADESATLRGELAHEVESAQAVLKSPDGKAAAKAERQALNTAIGDARAVVKSLGSVTWSPSGTEEQATVLLEQATMLHDDVTAASAALQEATQAVVTSGQQIRLERAVSGLEQARTGLQDAVEAGEQAYAESAQSVDAADRAGLRVVLDQAGDLRAQADGLLESAANAQSTASRQSNADAQDGIAPKDGTAPKENTVADLLADARELAVAMTEAADEVESATAAVVAEVQEAAAEADASAENAAPATNDTANTGDTGTDPATDSADTNTTTAGTCPEPDQVWSAENGHLSSSELAEIPFASGHYVRADVVGGLTELNDAYVAEFGVNLTINSSYRTYAQQEALYDP